MSYKILRAGVLLLLGGYFVIGLLLFVAVPYSNEVYPFFSWTLFRNVPQRTDSTVTVRFISADGKTFDPPILLDDSAGLIDIHKAATNDAKLAALRSAFLSSDTQGTRDARMQFEQTFTARRVTYEIVRLTYDTIEHWRTGKYLKLETLARFTSGDY